MVLYHMEQKLEEGEEDTPRILTTGCVVLPFGW